MDCEAGAWMHRIPPDRTAGERDPAKSNLKKNRTSADYLNTILVLFALDAVLASIDTRERAGRPFWP